MKPYRRLLLPAAAVMALLQAPALGGCVEDARPPASPQNAMDVPPPAPPPPAPAETAAAQGDETQYASAEYAVGENTDAYDDNDPSALKDFRPTLDPYGSWVDDKTYGTVWVPAESAVGADFTPYSTAGHWAYDDDWVWVSDYPWGWAPFHYGRWVLVEGRGWAWIPGRVYRGAWVTWAVDDGYTYVGWAPMGPEFVWFGGYAVGWGVYVGPRWVYCPRGEVFSPVVGTRIVAGPAVAPVAAHMRTFVSATPGVGGPPPQRLGFAPGQTPRAAGGAAAQSLNHAQAFARPSTAQPIGASAPTRVTTPASRPVFSTGSASRAPVGHPQPTGSVFAGPAVTPHGSTTARAPLVVPPSSAPAPAHTQAHSPPAAHSSPPSYHYSVPSGGGGGHHH